MVFHFWLKKVFYTLLIPSQCAEGDNGCRPAEYYLITYSVLLGELDDDLVRGIEDKVFALSLFFGFSFVMAIVMLNILIAVISDSYEKSMLRSTKLFGRARVYQLAEILALQDLFRVRDDNKLSHRFFEWTSFQWTKGGCVFFILTTFLYVTWIIIETFAQSSKLWFMSAMVFILNIFMFGIFVFLLASASQDIESRVKIDNPFVRSIHERIHRLMIRVLGKSENDALLHDQWSGRLVYIKREIAASTKKMKDSFEVLQQEVRNNEKQRRDFRRDFDKKMQQFEQTMIHLLEMKANESSESSKQYGERVTI